MINQAALLTKYDDKNSNYFLLDVRTPTEFSSGHIPGALNIQMDSLESQYAVLPYDKHIITVCQFGVNRSKMAEKLLRQKGFQADRLESGMTCWKGQISRD